MKFLKFTLTAAVAMSLTGCVVTKSTYTKDVADIKKQIQEVQDMSSKNKDSISAHDKRLTSTSQNISSLKSEVSKMNQLLASKNSDKAKIAELYTISKKIVNILESDLKHEKTKENEIKSLKQRVQ